jgi:hypothetical protein
MHSLTHKLPVHTAHTHTHTHTHTHNRMAATTCWLTDEAKAAITAWEHDGENTSALVLKCSTKLQEIQVEELIPDLTPEELGEELDEGSPR